MGITNEVVRRIAELARLRPDDDELDRLTGELNGILQHIERLEALDVSQVQDVAHVTAESISFRDPDLAPDRLEGGAPESVAPDWREGFFVVPRLPALNADDQGGEEE